MKRRNSFYIWKIIKILEDNYFEEESVRSFYKDEEIPDLPPLLLREDLADEIQGEINIQEIIADEKDKVTPESMIAQFLSKYFKKFIR